MNSDFPNDKKTFLAKLDKSKKGELDEKVLPLLNAINVVPDYYTTSSCSGRVYLWRGHEKKNTMEWLKVSHNLIDKNFFELKRMDLFSAIRSKSYQLPLQKRQRDGSYGDVALTTFTAGISKVLNKYKRFNKKSGLIWLRLEDFILHICCKDLDAANKLLQIAQPIYKKSCILSASNKIMVEIRGSELVEMPLYLKEKNLFCGDLGWLTHLINARMKQIWKKEAEFEKQIKLLKN